MKYIAILVFCIFNLSVGSISAIAGSCSKTCTKDAISQNCAIDCLLDESATCYCEEDGTAICKCIKAESQGYEEGN